MTESEIAKDYTDASNYVTDYYSVFAFGSRVLWTMARLNEQLQLNSINGSFDTVKGFMFHKYPVLKPMFK